MPKKKATVKTATTTTEPNPDETIEAPVEPRATVRLDTAIKTKTHAAIKTAIANVWAFVEKPNRDEFDPEVLDLLARMEIGKPRPTLEGGLVGLLLQDLDYAMRSKLRIEPAGEFKTFGPFVTGNARSDGFFPE